MQKIMKIGLVTLLFSANLFASAVQPLGEPRTVDVGGVEVKVFDKVNIDTANGKVAAKLTGAGLRSKGGFINVYYIASYIEETVTMDVNDPLAALKSSKAKALQLTLMNDWEADVIKNGLRDALALNGINVSTNKPIKDLMDQFDTELATGQPIQIISNTLADGTDQVTIELPSKAISSKDTEMGLNFWKIWFGKVATDMKKLRTELIGKGN